MMIIWIIGYGVLLIVLGIILFDKHTTERLLLKKLSDLEDKFASKDFQHYTAVSMMRDRTVKAVQEKKPAPSKPEETLHDRDLGRL